jgi:hypothetical protein
MDLKLSAAVCKGDDGGWYWEIWSGLNGSRTICRSRREWKDKRRCAVNLDRFIYSVKSWDMDVYR